VRNVAESIWGKTGRVTQSKMPRKRRVLMGKGYTLGLAAWAWGGFSQTQRNVSHFYDDAVFLEPSERTPFFYRLVVFLPARKAQ
jgi:hypothetical protein